MYARVLTRGGYLECVAKISRRAGASASEPMRRRYHGRFVAARTQRLVGLARKLPFPEGTFAVGAGIAIAGVTAYAFLSLASHQLGPGTSTVDYGAVFGLWVVVFTVAPGFFQPLEQEVGRAVAHRRAQGIGGGPLVKRAATLGGILALLAIVVSLAPDRRDHQQRVQRRDGAVRLPARRHRRVLRDVHRPRHARRQRPVRRRTARCSAGKGSSASSRRSGSCVAGSHSPGAFALVLVLPPVAAIAIGLRGQKNLLAPGPPAPYSELSSALGYLLLGSVLCQALSYSAYITAIVVKTPAQDDLVGKLALGILIARVPLLGFQAVQAALLPKLARLAGAGRDAEFRTALRQLVMIVLAVGVDRHRRRFRVRARRRTAPVRRQVHAHEPKTSGSSRSAAPRSSSP